ncbi:hypothetical protein ACTZWT_10395 [Rhodopseudomonas sp. NSM]|uniref:hypothetical protein n=1 Tax=Rhodopseudomonas sp. NSM TaxID=3457630 RepID=UPI004036E4DD
MRALPNPPAGRNINIKALRFRLRMRNRLPSPLRRLAPLIAPDPDLSGSDPSMEYIHLDDVLNRLVGPGKTCVDIGAFSGVYAKKFIQAGATTTAVEGFPSAIEELHKRIGRRCTIVPALLADSHRHYAITNKTEVRMIGDAPVYAPAPPSFADIESTTYDDVLGDEPAVDLVKISGCHICEALLGAHTLLDSDSHILFVMDQRYLPAVHRHDEFCLYDLLRRSGRYVFSCAEYICGKPPLTVWEFNKRALHGWKSFIATRSELSK